MGESAGPAASGLSQISPIAAAVASVYKAKGVKDADDYQAAELNRAAQYGDLKATQTSATMTQRLNQTLGNIDAIRAASHTDPTSPSGAAYRDRQEDIANTQKFTMVSGISAQSREQEANAAYLRKAGSRALLAGEIGAGAGLLGSIAKGMAGMPGGGGGGAPGPSAVDLMPDDI